MMRFCPLCMRNGLKRKIKAFQINFEEAVWSCEAETCPWPIGFDELTYFARDALGSDWNEEAPPPIGIPEENIPMSMELLLYTPPVTPGGELSKELTDSISVEYLHNSSLEDTFDEISLKSKVNSGKECTDFLPALEPSELESNNFIKERKSSSKEDSASTCKALPKITKIQRTNLDITFLLKNDECCDKEKMYKHNHLLKNATVKDIAENTPFDNILCKEIDLDTQCERESERKSSKLDNKINRTEKTNPNSESLVKHDAFHANDTNTTNDSSINILDANLNIDKILEDIMSMENHTTENTNNDWLFSLINI